MVLFYGDFACPKCAVAYHRLKPARVRLTFRHFALKAKHPRAVALALAAEAAANQGRFWELTEALYADPWPWTAAAIGSQNAQAGQSTVALNSDRNAAQSTSSPATAAAQVAVSASRSISSLMW